MSTKEIANTDGPVTVRELYRLIDDRIGEVNTSITRLDAKFDSLAEGRLTNVEREVSTINGKLIVVPTLIGSAIAIFGFILNYVIK